MLQVGFTESITRSMWRHDTIPGRKAGCGSRSVSCVSGVYNNTAQADLYRTGVCVVNTGGAHFQTTQGRCGGGGGSFRALTGEPLSGGEPQRLQ